MGLYKEPSPAGQKQLSSAVESPHNGRCGYGTHKTCFKTRGQRSNTVWISAVPTLVSTKGTSYILRPKSHVCIMNRFQDTTG